VGISGRLEAQKRLGANTYDTEEKAMDLNKSTRHSGMVKAISTKPMCSQDFQQIEKEYAQETFQNMSYVS
jgi:hypothetical protein